MDERQAAREAKALAAEWITHMRHATGWGWAYEPGDYARIAGELDRLQHKLEKHGPSLHSWHLRGDLE